MPARVLPRRLMKAADDPRSEGNRQSLQPPAAAAEAPPRQGPESVA